MLKFPLKPARGFTLVEMVIGISILSILIAMAVPSFSLWIRNMGIRAAAESLLSGLQLARSEALKRNTVMRFQLMDTLDGGCAPTASGPHWVISRDDAEGKCDAAPSETAAPRIVQFYDGRVHGKQTLIDAGANLFTFNGLGRLTSPAANILVSGIKGKDECASEGKDDRCLRIEATAGGSIRLCDPALPATDPQGCAS
ncbi:MAG: GspH/FimT family pseudopilin [Candidatus Accumulibacter sp.]|jgi:type IV fimbrial biogenesis protein FimT|nr:GspH/FimT family pseudopilin [Accumulibacter sp.]